MPWKLDESGAVVMEGGKPVLTNADGKDIPIDGDRLFSKIGELNNEASSWRKKLRDAESQLGKFEGIEDPAAALEALEKIQNIDQKKLIDAGEVEKVKAQISKSYQEKLTAAEKAAADAIADRDRHMIGGAFGRSKFISENLVTPPDFTEAKFGGHFKIVDGVLTGHDNAGNPIYSKIHPGEIADFDEALEIIVGEYPRKDSILKSKTKSGAGSHAGAGSGAEKTITRAEFDALGSEAQMGYIRDGGTVTD